MYNKVTLNVGLLTLIILSLEQFNGEMNLGRHYLNRYIFILFYIFIKIELKY